MSKKVSISLPTELYKDSVERQKALGYKKFSHYVSYLIADDVKTLKDHTEVRRDSRKEIISGTKPISGRQANPGRYLHSA